ncbi:hypothetical protein MASR1M107_12370 [Ignavibacteriales bacterium]
MRKVIIFVILSMITLQAQLKIEHLNPYPSAMDVEDINVLDDQTIFAVGEIGLVQRTTDGGQTWDVQRLDSVNLFTGIHFATRYTGYILTSSRNIYKTINGGDTWSKITIPQNLLLKYFTIKDSLTGYFSDYSRLIKTTDGGLTFSTVRDFGTIFAMSAKSNSIFLAGIISTQRGIFKSSDSGASWQLLDSNNYSIKDIDYDGISRVVAVSEDGDVVASTNGGVNWYKRDVGGYYFYRVCIASDSIFYATTSGSILRFRNFGTAQSTIGTSTGKSLGIKDSLIISGRSGGNIWRSTDDGKNWVNLRQGHNHQLYFPVFLDKDTGFATASYPGNLKKTTDGGRNWYDVPSMINQSVNNPVFLPEKKTGILIRDFSQIFRTSDGGYSWQLTNVSLPLGTRFRRVWFMDDSTGFVLSEDTTLYRTDNSGISWKKLVLTPQAQLMYDIHFLNKTTGFIAGRRNSIYKTDDGGNSWRRVNFNIFNTNQYCDARINFINDSTGMVYGWGMDDYKTTDGGETWFRVLPSKTYSTIDFYDRLNGVAFYGTTSPGLYNRIDVTRDGGLTWTKYNTLLSNQHVTSIAMIDLKTFLLTGSEGNVVRITDLGFTSIEDEEPAIISGYYIFNNYPNPFNPSTVISFSIPEREKVSLIVYDISGRVVAEPVKGLEMSAGRHEINFEAKGLASGVYFYNLITPKISMTGKMMLLK